MAVAELGEEMSDWVPVSLDEDLAPPLIRLVLRSSRTLAGRVVGPAGPVPGARLVVWPQLTSPGGGRIAQSLSGPDGSFEVELPSDAVAATVVALAPAYATRLLTLPLGPTASDPVEIVMEGHGGTLRVDLGSPHQGVSSRQRPGSPPNAQ